MPSVQQTIGSEAWVISNFKQLREAFPPERTLITEPLMARVGCRLRVMGVEWKDSTELAYAVLLCSQAGVFLLDREQNGRHSWITRAPEGARLSDSFFGMHAEQVRVNRLLREPPPQDVVELAAELIDRVRYQKH